MISAAGRPVFPSWISFDLGFPAVLSRIQLCNVVGWTQFSPKRCLLQRVNESLSSPWETVLEFEMVKNNGELQTFDFDACPVGQYLRFRIDEGHGLEAVFVGRIILS